MEAIFKICSAIEAFSKKVYLLSGIAKISMGKDATELTEKLPEVALPPAGLDNIYEVAFVVYVAFLILSALARKFRAKAQDTDQK